MKQGIDIQEFEKKANEIIANVGKKETLEEAVDKYTPLRIEQKAFIAGAEYQAKRMYRDLSELRNDLYNKLPISDVDAFEILKVIKNHLQKLDVLCGNK